MVVIIVYGVIAGIALTAVPFTRKIGYLVLSIVGILFLVTSALLLLGGLISSLLPVILIVGVIYAIYWLAINKGRPKI